MCRNPIFACLFLTICVLLAYANGLSGDFVLDDYQTLLGDKTLSSYLWPPGNVFTDNLNTRGFSMWTFAVNEVIGGSSAFSFHVGSVLIHLLATVAVYFVVHETTTIYLSRQAHNARFEDNEESEGIASLVSLMTAAIFATHPIQSQAVTYLSQRSEALMGLLFLLTIAALIQSTRSKVYEWKIMWLVVSGVCCLLGMRAKEAMIVAPLLVLWYDKTFLSSNWKELIHRRGVYHIALWATLIFNSSWQSLIPQVQKSASQTASQTDATTQQASSFESSTAKENKATRTLLTQKGARLSRWDYFRTQPSIILKYVWLVFWPQDFCFDRGHTQPPPSWIFYSSAAILTIAFLATVYVTFRAPAWGFLGAWFFINLGPRSSFIPLENPYFEYRMYLPVLSILIPLSCLIVLASKKMARVNQSGSVIYWLSLLAICITLAGVTHYRNELYADPVLLWSDTIEKAPENGRAHTNLTRALLMRHEDENTQEALRIGKRATELSPESALSFHFYGLALQRIGNTEEAIDAFNKAIANDPKLMHPYLNLGNIYSKTDPLKAFEYYKEAMVRAPDDPAVQTNYATTMLFNDIDVAKAEKILIDLANSRPTHIDSQLNLGLYYAHQGRYHDGIRWGEKVLSINPTHQAAIDLIKFCQQKLAQPN